MNKLVFLLVSILTMTGCSRKPKESYLTQDTLLKLNVSKVKEICIISRGKLPYSYEFSIHDPEKIAAVLRCMQDATQIADKQRFCRPVRPIAFQTQKVRYWTGIGWDDQVVYGDWEDENAVYHGRWESTQLREYFRQWNLIEEIVAADPNLPPPAWMINPPKIEDTMPPMPLPPDDGNKK